MLKHQLLILDIQPFKQHVSLLLDDYIQWAFDSYLEFIVKTYPREMDIDVLIKQLQYPIIKKQYDILPHHSRWEIMLPSLLPVIVEIIEVIDIYYQRTIRCALQSMLDDQKLTALRYNKITTMIILDVYYT